MGRIYYTIYLLVYSLPFMYCQRINKFIDNLGICGNLAFDVHRNNTVYFEKIHNLHVPQVPSLANFSRKWSCNQHLSQTSPKFSTCSDLWEMWTVMYSYSRVSSLGNCGAAQSLNQGA